jgi:ribosome biogenesis protein BMS1
MLHVCVICCRFEDVTPAEPLRLNPKADRDLLLYGYLRGAPLRQGARLHLAGVGDFDLQAS